MFKSKWYNFLMSIGYTKDQLKAELQEVEEFDRKYGVSKKYDYPNTVNCKQESRHKKSRKNTLNH